MKELEWSSSLNDVSKFVVPLLDDNLVKEDLCIESGFVDAYTRDCNRPWHSNNVFLLYELKNTNEALVTFMKLTKLDTLKTWYPLKIKGKHYRMFVFQKCNSPLIRKLIELGLTWSDETVIYKYCMFWDGMIEKQDIARLIYAPGKLEEYHKMKYVTPLSD